MKQIRLFAFLVLLSLMAACQLPSSTGPTPIPSPTIISVDPTFASPAPLQPSPTATNTELPPVPTLTEVLPTATLMSLATAVPTETAQATVTSIPPTATPTILPQNSTTPTATAVSSVPTTASADIVYNTGQSVIKVRFPYLSTGVEIVGSLPANQSHTYLLRAMQDQSFLTTIYTNNNDLVLALRRENGQALTPEKREGNNYEWRLPANEEYRLEVVGSGQSADYQLRVDIPRVVRFPAGSYGMVQYGRVNSGQIVLYRLRATPGQEMTLRLTAPQDSASLGVVGLQSGTQILSPDEEVTQWRGILPDGNTHYLVQVIGQGPSSVDYSLEFSIR